MTQLISLAEAANRLGVCQRTVRRRVAEGQLKAYKVGSVIRIDPAELETILRPIPNANHLRYAS